MEWNGRQETWADISFLPRQEYVRQGLGRHISLVLLCFPPGDASILRLAAASRLWAYAWHYASFILENRYAPQQPHAPLQVGDMAPYLQWAEHYIYVAGDPFRFVPVVILEAPPRISVGQLLRWMPRVPINANLVLVPAGHQ